jgi:hypothetical protein
MKDMLLYNSIILQHSDEINVTKTFESYKRSGIKLLNHYYRSKVMNFSYLNCRIQNNNIQKLLY